MNKCLKCGSEIPPTTVVNGKRVALTSRKFCLSCSPYKSNNRKDLSENPKGAKEFKRCPQCGETKSSSEFYHRSGKRSGLSCYCRKCHTRQMVDREQAFKKLCVEYKGGKCELCGYDRCVAALEFHHVDPGKKDFGISRARKKSFSSVQAELDKCQLLCAVCHAELHFELCQCAL